MEIRWVTRFGEFLELEVEWNSLLERSSFDALFLRHEWLRVWWEAYGGDARLRILLVRNGEKIIGIAPLMLERGLLRLTPVRMLKFMSSGVTPRSFLIVDTDHPSAIQAIMKGIYEKSEEWDIMELSNIPTDIRDYDMLLRNLSNVLPRYHVNQSRLSPYIRIAGDFDAYFASRSANTRSRFRRARKKVNAHGEVVIKKITDQRELINALGTAFQVSTRSWKADAGTDMGGTGESRRFYKALSEIGGKRGWIILWILYLDDQPIAMQFHVTYQERAYLLRTDFDNRFQSLSAGAALELEILSNYFESDLVEYDLCGTNYPYKMTLTDLVRPHSTIQVFNDHAYSRMLFLAKTYILPGIKGLRRSMFKLRP